MPSPPSRSRLLGLIAVVALAVSGCSSGEASAPEVVWQDDFDGPVGHQPDPAHWSTDVGGDGWGNRQLQYYTASAAVLDGNGNLVITAKPTSAGLTCWYGDCLYESARLTTYGKFSHQYGRFEVRMQLPAGEATWPAAWMMGDDRYEVGWPEAGELDIAEQVGRDGDLVSGAAHGPGFSGEHGLSTSTKVDRNEFHVYAIDWTPDSITWSVDGHRFHRLEKDKTPEWVFDHPFFILLNLAVGGTHAGEPGPDDQQPQEMIVDYVKVTALAD